MKKNKLDLRILVSFVLLSTGMNNQDPMIATMARLLHDRTKESIEWKEKYQKKDFEVRLLQLDIDETGVAHETRDFYRRNHADTERNLYCVDVKHIKKVWQLVKKYDYIVKDISHGDVNIRRFTMGYIVDQSGFSSTARCFNDERVKVFPKRKDGTPNPFYKTFDNGIMQINEIVEPLILKNWDKWIKEPIEIVKARDKDEYYIILFYIKLHDDAMHGDSWAKLSSDPSRGWNFYWQTRMEIN